MEKAIQCLWYKGLEKENDLIWVALFFKKKKKKLFILYWGSSAGKESACNVGDLGSLPGLERSPGEGNGYPLQHSCLENSMDRGAWRVTIQGSQRVGHDRTSNT